MSAPGKSAKVQRRIAFLEVRIMELNRLFRYRYGDGVSDDWQFPNTAQGRTEVMILLQHMAELERVKTKALTAIEMAKGS